MRVDSHQHFWVYDSLEYPWIQPNSPLQRDYLPPDLEPLLRAAELDGCVAVQARQSIQESRWLLQLAREYGFILGVVGWVDLRSDQVEAQLAELSRDSKFSGVRHVVQDERDDEFMLRDDFQRGISLLKAYDLAYDILIFPRQLSAAIQLARNFPEQRFVLDHLAKPPISDQELEPWGKWIEELGACPNVSCKISGMVTEAGLGQWRAADFRPFLDRVWEAFGEDRLMVGSDWPVCRLNGEYLEVMKLASDYLAQFSAEAQQKVFGHNAERVYRLQS